MMPMSLAEAVRARRSIKKFTARPVTREEIAGLLELAALPPVHRMTQPWGYVVLGPEARQSLGRIRGEAKALTLEDPAAAQAVRERLTAEIASVPAIVAFTQRLEARPDIREEDYAAVFMGVQSFLLGAAAIGLGTHVKTGADLDLPATRALLGADDGVRVVALVHLGEPAEIPTPKARATSAERTRWLP